MAQFNLSKVKQFLTSLPHINMKTILLSIISTMTIFGLGFGVLAYANNGVDYKARLQQQIEEMERKQEEARLAACSYLGQLTAECYQGDASSCERMEAEELEYGAQFKGEAYQDCVVKTPEPGTVLESGEIVESETGIPEQVMEEVTDPTNPLFFDDMEGK